MSKKRMEEVKEVLRRSDMKEDDYFSSLVFYYLAGYFPNMKLSDCANLISHIRDEIIEGTYKCG